MRFMTRDFGEYEVRDEEIFEFLQPPFGFEEYKKYALIHDEGIGDQIAWLQSVEEPAICFILFDPSGFSSFYNPDITEDTVKGLGADELLCWVIGVVPEEFKKTTVNLKSPVILNPKTRKGAQIILDQDYPVHYLLIQGE